MDYPKQRPALGNVIHTEDVIANMRAGVARYKRQAELIERMDKVLVHYDARMMSKRIVSGLEMHMPEFWFYYQPPDRGTGRFGSYRLTVSKRGALEPGTSTERWEFRLGNGEHKTFSIEWFRQDHQSYYKALIYAHDLEIKIAGVSTIVERYNLIAGQMHGVISAMSEIKSYCFDGSRSTF